MAVCDISGILYKTVGLTASTAPPLTSFSFTVGNGELDTVSIGQAGVTITTDASTGAFSFAAQQGTLITVRGNFTQGDYNFKTGVKLFVPYQSSVDFDDLKTAEDYCQALGADALYAPVGAKYIIQTANASLSNAQVLGALSTGMLKSTTTTGVLSIATAADLPLISTLTADASPDSAADYVLTYDASAGAHKKVLLSNLPGGGGGGGAWGSITGTLSSQTDLQSALDLKAPLISPSFTTPTLGVALATSINKVALTAPATGSTLTIADGKTLTASNTVTLTATDGSTLAIGAGGTLGSAAYTASSAYEVPLTFSTGLTRSTNTITVDTSVIATKSYADSLVVGLLDDRGNYDASGNVFPSSGGSGTAGAVLKGDLWTVSVAGTLGGTAVTAGDLVRALVDTPGQTASNWAVSETNIGYTALNASLSSGQLYIGNASDVGTARTLSGDVTVSNTGVTAIGATKVTSAMLNADVFSTAHSWGGQQTFTAPILGTPASGTLTSCTGLPPTTGISGWPANASGVLTNNGSGTLSWAAAGGGITIGTTTITSGTNTKVLFNNSGVVGEYTITGTGNVAMSASPTFTGTVAAAALTASSTITQTSNSATAFESGPNGGTNPVFRLVNSTASSATGLSITGNAAGSGVTLTALSSGSNDGITYSAKGTGKHTFSSTSGSSLILDTGNSTTAYSLQGATTALRFLNLAGSAWVKTSALKVGVDSTGYISFGTFGGETESSFFRSSSAATFAFGNANANPPVAQTIGVQSATGTNIAGATTKYIGSLGTSQGVPGILDFQTGGLIAASGTTQQTAVSRQVLGASKVLANNSATAIVNVTDASNTVAAGIVDYAIEVFDGTDLQVESGSFTYQVTNKGGTIANNTITFPTGFPKNVTTSGTLTATWTITAANPAVLTLNANSSLTPSTGYPRVTYAIRNLTQQAIAPQ